MIARLRIAPSFAPDHPEPTGFAAKAQIIAKTGKNHGSRNTTRAKRPARWAVFRGKVEMCQTSAGAPALRPKRLRARIKAGFGACPELKTTRPGVAGPPG